MNTINVCDIYQLAFVVLKLCGVIDWNWWFVLSPLWVEIIYSVAKESIKQKQTGD